ncbi:MAG: hypothetical protein ACXIU7_02960 [Roseinatronobacter sp.]
MLTLAAVGAALIPPAPYAAVPDHLRPGAWSQDTLSARAALALLAVSARLRQGWAKGWLIWAGLITDPRPRPPPGHAVARLFGLLVMLVVGLWLSKVVPAMAARQPLPAWTLVMLDLAFALPLTALAARTTGTKPPTSRKKPSQLRPARVSLCSRTAR